MRFYRLQDKIVVEKVRTGQRYVLKRWQYEVLARFNGESSFEEVAKLIYTEYPGAFTAIGLLNFYNWLYSEDIVVCECDSIFELILSDTDSETSSEVEAGLENPFDDASEENLETEVLQEESVEEAALEGDSNSDFIRDLLKSSTAKRSLAVAATLVFCLSVIRLVYVTAPVFEPPVQRLYAEMGKMLEHRDRAVSLAESERSAADSEVEKVALASQVGEMLTAAAMESDPDGMKKEAKGSPSSRAEEQEASKQVADAGISLERIEALRIELEECRIRRDEFYLQDDEEGYRKEVHNMTRLAREIGDIEDAQ